MPINFPYDCNHAKQRRHSWQLEFFIYTKIGSNVLYMGNSSPRNVTREIGSNVMVVYNLEESKCNEKNRNDWSVSYFIERPYFFGLSIDIERRFLRLAFIEQRDQSPEEICLFMRIDKNELLEIENLDEIMKLKCTKVIIEKENNDIQGYFAKTSIFTHAGGRGNVIVEQRSKKRGMNPYKVSFEHYYDALRGNKLLFILGMTVDITVTNNEFILSATGPVEHSNSSMNKILVSKAELLLNRERGEVAKPQVAPQVPYSSKSERSLVANQGAVRGNYNGNVHYNQYFYVHQVTLAASSPHIK